DVEAQTEIGDARAVDAEEDDGCAREELRPVLQRDTERATPRGNDEVDVVGAVLPAQERLELRLGHVAVEEREVPVLRVEVDRKRGLRLQRVTERLVEPDDRRRQPGVGMEKEDVPRRPVEVPV